MSSFANLAQVLRDEVKHYNGILSITEEMQKALVANNFEELNSALKKQQLSIVASGKLEEERSQVLANLGTELGLSAKDITLSMVIEVAPQEKREEFIELQKQLTDKVDKIKTVSSQNEVLIKDSLSYIDYAMKMFTAIEEKKTYDRGSEQDANKRQSVNRVFDKRV
ncbi:flagellar biosynthesis/type III secretory pathway chaperone [Desulfitispora alkaliphila]|uniref:flagellar protein FlgN n=1 Tax=Desulfitispora alkaliphila TaxID=622674 RepID=UPI003D220111